MRAAGCLFKPVSIAAVPDPRLDRDKRVHAQLSVKFTKFWKNRYFPNLDESFCPEDSLCYSPAQLPLD